MRNSRLVENRTDSAKSHLVVESDHRHLSVQVNLPRISAPGCRDSALEQLPSYALAPVSFQNRHAPDLGAIAMQHHPRRAHRSAA